MNFKSNTLLAMAALTAAFSVQAQTKAPEPDYTLGFNAGLTSDYRYRGISQTRLNPALQGGVDFSHKSGIYLGAWASTIKWIKDAGGGSNVELDLYGGYKGSAGDLGYDIGLLRYQYSGHDLVVSPNTTEVYAALSVGPATLKYSHSTTNLFGWANSKNSGYLDLSASFDLGNGWSLAPHIGRQKVSNFGLASYTDYSLTLNKDIDGLVLSVAAVGTNADKPTYTSAPTAGSKFLGKSGLVVSVKKNF